MDLPTHALTWHSLDSESSIGGVILIDKENRMPKPHLKVFGPSLLAVLGLASTQLTLTWLLPDSRQLINRVFIAITQVMGQGTLFYAIQERILSGTGKGLIDSILHGFAPPPSISVKHQAGEVAIGSPIFLPTLLSGTIEEKITLSAKELDALALLQYRNKQELGAEIKRIEGIAIENSLEAYLKARRSEQADYWRAVNGLDKELMAMSLIAYSSIVSVLA